MWKKRGQAEARQLILVFEFLAGMIIFGILVYNAYLSGGDENFVRQYTAKSVALMIETSYSVPGNLDLVLPIGEPKYNIKVKKKVGFDYCYVNVDDYDEASFFYAHDKVLDARCYYDSTPAAVRFLKTKDGLILSDGELPEFT